MMLDQLPRTTVDLSRGRGENYLQRITTDRSGNRVVETIPISSIPHLGRQSIDVRLKCSVVCFAIGAAIGLLWFALERM